MTGARLTRLALILLAVAGLATPAAADWRYTSFRIVKPASLSRNEAKIDVVVDQGPLGVPAKFFAHAQEPKSRHHGSAADGVTSGLPLGTVAVPANKALAHTFRVKVSDLARIGVQPGGKVHLAMVCDVAGAKGGLHEYGVDGDRDVSVALPPRAQPNSRLRRSRQPLWARAFGGVGPRANRCRLVRAPRRPVRRVTRRTTRLQIARAARR